MDDNTFIKATATTFLFSLWFNLAASVDTQHDNGKVQSKLLVHMNKDIFGNITMTSIQCKCFSIILEMSSVHPDTP